MDFFRFVRQIVKKSFVTLVLAVVAFAFVLVTSFNLLSAVLVATLFVFMAVFQQSFSRGWLFLFLILLLLPAMRITGEVTVRDIFLVMLSIIGLLTIILENRKVPLNRLSFYFMLQVLVAGAIIAFGNYFGQIIDQTVWILLVTFILMWALLITFQFLFQTKKRLKRFFVSVAIIGVIHSVFGLFMYALGWQTSAGMGVTSGKFRHLIFGEINFQINGFLGNGMLMRVGESALAPLLLITIPVTLGLFISKHKRRKVESKSAKTPRQFFDLIFPGDWKSRKVVNLRRSKDAFRGDFPVILSKRSFLLMALIVQMIALLLTYSYVALVILFIGFFVMGILLRNRMLLSATASMLIVLSIAFPGFRSSITEASMENIDKWFWGMEKIVQSPFWGHGWRLEMGVYESSAIGNDKIYNSYLYVWNTFGVIGFIVLLGMLFQYFSELRAVYLKSDDWYRIWLIVILAVFVEFVILGLTSNALVFGPAAILFWVLYGAVLNLQKRKIVFGLTETKIVE